VDTVVLGQPGCCRNKLRPVVGNDFFHPTPPAEYILKDPPPDLFRIFNVKRTPLRPSCERTSAMDNISILISGRHVHRVAIKFAEERGRVGDGWRYCDVVCSAVLAFQASVVKPSNVSVEVRPPEPKE
jgi:hypothetical protein